MRLWSWRKTLPDCDTMKSDTQWIWGQDEEPPAATPVLVWSGVTDNDIMIGSWNDKTEIMNCRSFYYDGGVALIGGGRFFWWAPVPPVPSKELVYEKRGWKLPGEWELSE